MSKSKLQLRAEKAAATFRASPRPAIVIEFAGLPKAGKTSTLSQVYAFLRRCGFQCEIVVERASVCPVRDKKHFNFNIWTACTSISQLLEKTQNPPRDGDPDILFLDRGVFDALCWFSLLQQLGRIRQADRKKVSDFLLVQDWTNRITGVIAMTADPSDAMQREKGVLPIDDVQGSIMNPPVLRRMNGVINDMVKTYKRAFNIFTVNTSSPEFKDKFPATCEAIVSSILGWVEASTEERILSAPKTDFPALGKHYIADAAAARDIVDIFEAKGDFLPRKAVESDSSRIQPLPVVVVRNSSGDILQLIRKERSNINKLHKKIAVWAGGHVHKDDLPGGNPILHGAIRELEEELRLYVEASSLKLIGVVYIGKGKSTKKHVAIVYEWRAPNDDVEVTLARSEFFEKGGTSLTGRFVAPKSISVKDGNLEAWSKAILANLLQTEPA